MSKSDYRVDIKSARHSAIAAGHKSRAVAAVTTSPAEQDYLRRAITESERLIELLDARRDTVADGKELAASAAKIRKKLGRKRPRLKSVRGMLEQIAEGVAGVGVLAECVARIQTLITHIPS